MKFYDKENKRLLLFEKKATIDFWDKHWQSDDFAKTVRYGKNSRLIKKFTTRFLKKDAKILEGGCGTGQNVYTLGRLGYDCYGVDFAAGTIEEIKQYFPELKIDVQDLKKLNFPNCFFDGYWSLGVIEHNFEGYGDILAEAARVIKPKGYLFLTFPFMSPLRQAKAYLGLYPLLTARKDETDNFYEFIFDQNEVKNKICHFGFAFVSRSPFDAVKGLKDEISFLKPFLKKIYQSRNILARTSRYLVSVLFAPLFGHSIIMVFQKND
ncbi:MAG: class I SAM-dependent methyltransferase [Candidatus Pacebacteria bacterium]|nr:class I SAM-dependent methyltransferase [Candidatus Paceibacterota bacterium]